MSKHVTIVCASGRGVADRWREQYFHGGVWSRTVTGDSEAIYNKLCDLGINPDIEAVAEVIGNKSWSYLSCDSCSEHVTMAAPLSSGEYGSAERLICRTCVTEAVAAFAKAAA